MLEPSKDENDASQATSRSQCSNGTCETVCFWMCLVCGTSPRNHDPVLLGDGSVPKSRWVHACVSACCMSGWGRRMFGTGGGYCSRQIQSLIPIISKPLQAHHHPAVTRLVAPISRIATKSIPLVTCSSLGVSGPLPKLMSAQ